MADPRKPIFDAIRAARGKPFTQADVIAIDDVLDDLGIDAIAPLTGQNTMSISVGSPSPRWYALARALIGTREIVGAQHSPTIMSWIAKLGAKALGIAVKDDETPWCGTFLAHLMFASKIDTPPIAVRASAWASWGRELTSPRLGCVLVFTRDGGGHVGLYVGERSDAYRVLGGNQGNAVSETWIAKSRLAKGGMRWPAGETLPDAGRIMLANDGRPLSINEA